MSEGIGANFGSSWIFTSVKLPCLGSESDETLPTDTPPIRTSACGASVTASRMSTVNSYFFALNGVGPPKLTQRKSSRPKQDSAKPTATRIRAIEGACFCISSLWAADRRVGGEG